MREHERNQYMGTKETAICVESPFKNNIELFDNKDMFPDMELVVSGLKKPILLHKGIMAKSSKLIEGLLRVKESAKAGDSNQIEWLFDTSAERDRVGLLKALRFCYDETMTVNAKGGELCAVIAALCRLQVTCLEETILKLSNFAVKQAKKDVFVGKEMLKETQLYPECRSSHTVELDKLLAKVVLTRKNICEHFDDVVNDCLIKLPLQYLDITEYGEPHTQFSEFGIRAQYLETNHATLSRGEKEMTMNKCDLTTLTSKELMKLRELNIFGEETMTETCLKALERTEAKMQEYKEMSKSIVPASMIKLKRLFCGHR